jgi:hypothetical protein
MDTKKNTIKKEPKAIVSKVKCRTNDDDAEKFRLWQAQELINAFYLLKQSKTN